VWIAVCFGLGIWSGTMAHFHWPVVVMVCGLLCCFGFLFRSFRWSSFFIYLLFIVLGFVFVSNAQTLPSGHVADLSYEERRGQIAIEGVVVSETIIRQSTHGVKTVFEMSVERVDMRGVWQKRRGKVLVNIFRNQQVQYGDRIRLNGRLHKPFEGSSLGHFSYENFLKRNGIYWIFSVKKSLPVEVLAHGQGWLVQAGMFRIRQSLQKILDEHLTGFEAGVIQSLVLGGKYYIPDRTRELFVQTGTAHILAISGMNVASMAFLVFLALNVLRFSRRWQIILTIVFLIIYCLFTGSNPSVVRAVIMAVVMLGGLLLEKEADTLNSLGLSAIIILVLDPLSLFDIGFQLSFGGVFSIIYFYPKIYRLVEPWAKGRIRIFLWQALCVSLAAWLGVLPLIGYYFQVITPVSIFANIPIIPFVSILFMLGVILILTGLFLPTFAYLCAACIKVVLFGLMMIVEVFSRTPFGFFYIREVTIQAIIIYYVVLGIVFLRLSYITTTTNEADKHLHYLS
jgi:competence protein ComEC